MLKTFLLLVFISAPTFLFAMENEIRLTAQEKFSKQPLCEAINKRYSCRSFSSKALKKEGLSYILWGCYGERFDAISAASKTVPSAGAIYPLNIYVLIAKDGVEGIESGFYQYSHQANSLILKKEAGDLPALLTNACLNQVFVEEAPVNIIICSEYGKIGTRYGERGKRYADIEAGHSCQNINLIAYELGLATVEVGAFNDSQVKKILDLDKNETPLLIMPIGYPK